MIYLIKSLNDGLYSLNSNQILLIFNSVNWTILGKVAKYWILKNWLDKRFQSMTWKAQHQTMRWDLISYRNFGVSKLTHAQHTYLVGLQGLVLLLLPLVLNHQGYPELRGIQVDHQLLFHLVYQVVHRIHLCLVLPTECGWKHNIKHDYWSIDWSTERLIDIFIGVDWWIE